MKKIAIIDVNGGVAEIRECDDDVKVIIVDHDNLMIGHEEAVSKGETTLNYDDWVDAQIELEKKED